MAIKGVGSPVLSDYRIAVHECGHAITQWESPYAIRPLPKREVLVLNGERSVFRYRDAPLAAPRSANKLWDEMVIQLGGLAAEELIFNNEWPERPHADDFLAGPLRRAMELGHSHPPWASPSKPGEPWFFAVLKPTSTEARTLALAYSRAMEILTSRRESLDVLARLLVDRRALTSMWLRRVLGPRQIDRTATKGMLDLGTQTA